MSDDSAQRFENEELNNSFPIDLGRRLRGGAGTEIVERVLERIAAIDCDRIRAQRASAAARQRASVEVLLANLAAAHLNRVDSDRFVAVAFGRNEYVGLPISHDGMKSARNALAVDSLIDVAPGFTRYDCGGSDDRFGRRTRIRATLALRDLFDEYGIGARSLSIPSNQLVRINKPAANAGPMPIALAGTISLLEAVNTRLSATSITVPEQVMAALKGSGIEGEGEDEQDLQRKRSYAGDLTATSIYRAFRGNWQSGGRFYGGWWMSFPKQYRPYIRINNAPVVELDYKTLHPALLAIRTGEPLIADPYVVPSFDTPEMRKVGKRTFNRLLNKADSDLAGLMRMRAKPEDTKALAGRMKFSQYLALFLEGVRTMQPWFGTGEGVRLQREDSELAQAVMKTMENASVPVLPIHDSFIVPLENEGLLREAMTQAYRTNYGCNPLIERVGPAPGNFGPKPRP